MEITKGKHIILKRDKLNYATNICGKWEDYSIDTYQGKAIKEAAERLKTLLKECKPVDDEVASLKSILLKKRKVEISKPTDLWDMPQSYTPVEEKVDNIPSEITNQIVEKSRKETSTKYVVTAGVNKIGRQLYISSYDDAPNDWSISVVPYATTKTRCNELIALANKELKEQAEKKRFRSKQIDIPFEIKEWQVK